MALFPPIFGRVESELEFLTKFGLVDLMEPV